MKTKGKVFLVGAGPGHPGLITLRGLECVRQADLILYDYLSNPALLRHARAGAEALYVGKRARRHALNQRSIENLMILRARAGKTVVRLKGGDPLLFGRGAEEAEALRKARIAVEIVPGVTAATAVTAYAGIPVTHREHASAIALVTGHEDPAKEGSAVDYRNLAAFGGTLVFYMGVERVGRIAAQLVEHGKKSSTPVALIRWGTTGRQQTLVGTLADIASRVRRSRFAPPALIVVGSVVKLRARLNWFEKLPLFGRRIVVTRTRAQAGELRRRLEELGAEVIELPTIEILPPRDPKPLARAVGKIAAYDWLVFTSPNGVDCFFKEFDRIHGDIRRLGPVRLAAIGPATAAKLRERGLRTDLMPREYVAERIVNEMKKQKGRGRVLLARADIARDALPRGLRRIGYHVDEAAAYRTVPAPRADALDDLLSRGADCVTFTSSSTAENFAALLGRKKMRSLPGRPRMASIGPVTSATLRKLGLKVSVEAKTHTIPGLVARILQAVKSDKRKA